MFRNTYQKGFLSIFYSLGSKPLSIWKTNVRNIEVMKIVSSSQPGAAGVQNGHIKRLLDDGVQSIALEIMGSNVATTYITTPIDPKQSLGIKLPFLVLLVKNMRKFFSFEVTILDDKNMHRRFRVSNYQSTTRVKPFSTSMPLGLSPGWNQIQFNLADFTRRAYGSNYVETCRVQIHANVRIRRIYFTDRLYTEEELPPEFRIMTSQTDVRRGSGLQKKDIRPEARPPTPEKGDHGTIERPPEERREDEKEPKVCMAACATGQY